MVRTGMRTEVASGWSGLQTGAASGWRYELGCELRRQVDGEIAELGRCFGWCIRELGQRSSVMG